MTTNVNQLNCIWLNKHCNHLQGSYYTNWRKDLSHKVIKAYESRVPFPFYYSQKWEDKLVYAILAKE